MPRFRRQLVTVQSMYTAHLTKVLRGKQEAVLEGTISKTR